MKQILSRMFCSAFILFSCFSATVVFADDAVFPVNIAAAATDCQSSVLHSGKKADFCSTSQPGFSGVVACNCLSQKHPAVICNNAKLVYNLMKAQYASYGNDWLAHACQGHGTSVQECEDQWNCYMYGVKGTSANEKISDGECFGQTDATAC